MEIVNPGLLVKSDRFSLKDPTEYRIYGYVTKGTEITAEADGKPLRCDVRLLYDYVDERFGGTEACVSVFTPPAPPIRHRICLYADRGGKKNLVHELSAGELAEKSGPIQYYIDETFILRDKKTARIMGWAAAAKETAVSVENAEGQALPAVIEKVPRLDVSQLYEETAVPELCGFDITVPQVPKNGLYLVLRSGGTKVRKRIHTGKAGRFAERFGYLYRKGVRYLKVNGLGALIGKTWHRATQDSGRPVLYDEWIEKHLPSETELSVLRNTHFPSEPLISILIPLYRTPEAYLSELIETILRQTYANWECILSDGSGEGSPLTEFLDRLEKRDARFRILRNKEKLHIAENTNAALSAASGEFAAFVDHDDLLVESALSEIVKKICEYPHVDLIYTDEDKVVPRTNAEVSAGDETGADAIGIPWRYAEPNLKPDYDPDLLRSENYICHLLVVRRKLAQRLGGLDPSMNGAQDYDFILRCTEKTDKICHVPKILYHWRATPESTAMDPESKEYAFTAGKRAIEAHYRRMGWPAAVEYGTIRGTYRTRYEWPEKPLVSVLIPNKDHIDDLRTAVTSLLEKTAWPNIEIVVIENNSSEESTFQGYRELEEQFPVLRTVTYEGPFNYSAVNNFGAQCARGEYFLLLNNDTEAISDIVTEMMGFAMRRDVGAVGARLYYRDDTIQHAGVVLGWGGIAGHAFVNQKRDSEKYIRRLICQQDYSAVTAACMMVPRRVFTETGGFSEDLAVAFNDIDLCMKIRKAGYLIVYDPYAELYHYESKSRGLEYTPEKRKRFQGEVNTFRKRWGDVIDAGDPYYNPNLSMITQDFSLRRL
ncbi:MAG: glycosyltransferase family 2 protein [Lachnospiraceae bacterium]|nr:glycosyltransferase family 2 protein [Lachnospiraceae bacterium]